MPDCVKASEHAACAVKGITVDVDALEDIDHKRPDRFRITWSFACPRTFFNLAHGARPSHDKGVVESIITLFQPVEQMTPIKFAMAVAKDRPLEEAKRLHRQPYNIEFALGDDDPAPYSFSAVLAQTDVMHLYDIFEPPDVLERLKELADEKAPHPAPKPSSQPKRMGKHALPRVEAGPSSAPRPADDVTGLSSDMGRMAAALVEEASTVNTVVMIQGLNTRSDLNNCLAKVIRPPDKQTGRIGVKVFKTGEGVNVRLGNTMVLEKDEDFIDALDCVSADDRAACRLHWRQTN